MFLGTLHNAQLTLSETHRIQNLPRHEKKEVLWGVAQLHQETLTGLLDVGLHDEPADGISCTSWGDDYLLFHVDVSFIPPTRHHADLRKPGAIYCCLMESLAFQYASSSTNSRTCICWAMRRKAC